MHRACFDAGMAVANHPFPNIRPSLARKNPVIPAAIEPRAMQSSNSASGRWRSRVDSGGPNPSRAETASPTPRQHPTHHVARIPHCKARRVGDVSGSTLGCTIEKYSTQILTVTWSWSTPYAIAAARLSNQIFTASTSAPKRSRKPYFAGAAIARKARVSKCAGKEKAREKGRRGDPADPHWYPL